MKSFLAIAFLFFSSSMIFSQNASTYFPQNPGYKWYYKNTPLDSLNNPQSSLATYQVDSFANVTSYQGLTASKLVSKSGLASINQNSPYTDTNYYNFQSTNAWYYLNVSSLIGSIPFLDSAAFVNFLRSFEAWYNTYRFGQSVNTNYTIFSKDTTVTFDTLTLPLRISTTGRRLNDATVNTVNGIYNAKKFLVTFQLSYGLLPPILYIPIVTRPDTLYFAQDVWLIKETMPSVNIDLSALGFPVSFYIPGVSTELTQSSTGLNNMSNYLPDGYRLNQNFPNPFNPATTIEFTIADKSNVKLIVYNAVGMKVSTLVDENKSPGLYSVEFDGSGFSSGVYFYKLETDKFSETKKLILMK